MILNRKKIIIYFGEFCFFSCWKWWDRSYFRWPGWECYRILKRAQKYTSHMILTWASIPMAKAFFLLFFRLFFLFPIYICSLVFLWKAYIVYLSKLFSLNSVITWKRYVIKLLLIHKFNFFSKSHFICLTLLYYY